MTSLNLLGALLALAVSSLLSVWFLANKKSHAAGTLENKTANPVSLPKGWWSNAERFQAERRAIFSQTWTCVSHRGRFKKPGDYIVYEVAGFRFFMILVARKDAGSSTVLGCRFHGWSYDYTGRLIKAPYFDNNPSFDRSQNGLFAINTKEDKNGFLYINPETDPKIAESTPPQGVATRTLVKITPDLSQVHSFELDGVFNWKLIVNEFGPSGPTPATGMAKLFPMFFATTTARLDIYPLTVVHTASGSNYWYQITYNPISATKTSVRCDLYSAKSSGSPQLDQTTRENLEQEVKQRIQALEAEHKKVTAFGYDAVSTSQYQEKIASVVESHIKQERLQGCEIRPAEVKAQPTDKVTAKAESICAAVDCGEKKLDW
ncbi:hypothetical protein FIE12Z_9259 [Fusarium flagelliforme]|uniref:Rieske domain-containing protein n=1 Tax=Fusarium flagelliforme TaxID=2675880 RepID=A0A395MH89_9HYPO|nr:hypothetical protein FIE12Z_9259 [Fusarium flagelliforme]